MSAPNQQRAAPRNPAVQRVTGMNFDGASDRQGGPAGSSHQGSNRGSISGPQAGGSQRGDPSGSPSRSRSGSNAGVKQPGSPSKSGPGGYHKGTGVDPAFDPNDPRSSRPTQLTETDLIGKRVDLPAEAFRTPDGGTLFAKRPGFNTTCKQIQVQLNLFAVTNLPSGDVQQCDLNVSPNPKDSRALVTKVWHSKTVQDWMRSTGSKWLCDGHKLAWSSKPLAREVRLTVDLDKEAGKTQVGRNGVHYVQIRPTATIRMQMLKSYLKQQTDWDSHILQCMNFLDHLMRQWPSEHMQTIKRNFYPQSGAEQRLDEMISVRKGTYSAFRLGENDPKLPAIGLSLNVDVANTAFWLGGQTLARVAQFACGPPGARNIDTAMPIGKLADILRPKKTTDRQGNTRYIQSDDFKKLRRMLRLKFHITHRGKENNPKVYLVNRIIFDEKYGARGADSFNVTFMKKNREAGTEEGPVRIYDHWVQKYGRLGYPDLPLVETKRDGIFPMEVCKLIEFQRYAYKLDPEQTSQMIKIAVSRPKARKMEINHGMQQLKWDQDPYFREYGVRVQNTMTVSSARLIPNPEVHFGSGAKLNPGMAGRWDLRGKKFIEPNPRPLVSWGFIGCGTNDGIAVEKDALKAFAQNFARVYRGHGGLIKKDPFVECYPYSVAYPDMCTQGYNDTGKFCKDMPQILFFVTSTRNQLVYDRIKKNMDCRICLISQNMLADHVKKNNAQYCSNVAMKVNAKLGGATCRAIPVGAKPGQFTYFNCPTMILGMDVSHGAAGSGAPSKAALTMSIDKTATKYCSNVQTNGYRREIVGAMQTHFLFERLMRYWVRTNGCPPKHVYYFRDGVSEGMFAHVIDQEIKELKRMFRDAGFEAPRFTVIVATKRHHIRFFPKAGDLSTGDKNENPLPGTLVEHDATHPFHFDFYLASHVAIQGTARPVHYSVILDEANCNPDKLQQMIYHQCYQYMRSTTPVSLHPAVYYSHLASQRAACHEDIAASQREMPSGKAGFPLGKASSLASGAKPPTEAADLIAMSNPGANANQVQHLNTTMWYI